MIQNKWFKSSKSGAAGHCLEARWQKSTFSGIDEHGNCVEARAEGNRVLIRDTKLGEASPVLSVTEPDWASFINEVRMDFVLPSGVDLRTAPGGLHIDLYLGSEGDGGARLRFNKDEWAAFVAGVENREFDLQDA